MIVWISSYPRSGNSFCRLALYRTFGLKSTSEYDINKVQPQNPHLLYHFGYLPELNLEQMASAKETYYVKTHHLPRGDSHPAIYLVRDGRDSLVSYAWYYLEKDLKRVPETISAAEYHDTLRQLIVQERSPFGRWSENVLAWIHRPNTYVIPFEKLISTPALCLSQATEALSLSVTPINEPIPGFAELKANRPYAFRRGVVGSWKDEFPTDLLELFWDIHGSGMKACGYPEPTNLSPWSKVSRSYRRIKRSLGIK
jgi:hypothetical protein